MIKNIAFVAALLAAFAGSAQAASFEYAYTSTGGPTISGSFDGTVSGDLVKGLTNIKVAFNGIPSTAQFIDKSYQDSFIFALGGAVASFTGTQNNFAFVEDRLSDVDNYVFFGYVTSLNTVAFRASTLDQQVFQTPNISNWSLRAVAAVPEPETYALMLAGLGLMGAVARRRKVNQA